MRSPAHDIALYLEENSVGTFGAEADWGLFVGSEPATPGNCITIYDTPGGAPDTDELDVFRVALQIRVRADDYPAGYAKHEAIKDLLIKPGAGQQSELITGSSRFWGVMLVSDVGRIGSDSAGRHLLVANYRAIRSANPAFSG